MGQILSIFDRVPAIHPYIHFLMKTWGNVHGFSPILVCALILWRSALGLMMGNFCQYLTVICPWHVWIITLVNVNGFSPKLVCALVLWRSAFGLLIGKFCLFLTELSAHNTSEFYFQNNNLSKSQWIVTKFDMCSDIVEISFGIAHWQFSSMYC